VFINSSEHSLLYALKVIGVSSLSNQTEDEQTSSDKGVLYIG
jgi:hypothetical protein